MKPELFKNAFKQVSIPNTEMKNSGNYISFKQLMSLIQSESFRHAIQEKYPYSDDESIEIGNIDTALNYIQYITQEYEYLNFTGNNGGVETFLNKSNFKESEEIFFKIDSLKDENDNECDTIIAEGIYGSSSMLYKDRKLSPYINFLKSDKKGFGINILERNKFIKVVNDSWKEYYTRNPDNIKPRVFRFLRDKKDIYYLRSITSESYKEYGVAFCFVVSMLAFHQLMQQDKGSNFRISSLAINESKIDLVITDGKIQFLDEINSYLSASVLISNNDLGNKSLSFVHSLNVQEKKDSKDGFYIFPKDKSRSINYRMSSRHTDNIETVLKLFDSLPEAIHYMAENIRNFEGFIKSKTPDELRAKIEERIKSRNSPFRGVKQVEDLFSRSTSQHINNMSELMYICKKAEMLDIDFDLKSKLRYIISDVMLYGRSR